LSHDTGEQECLIVSPAQAFPPMKRYRYNGVSRGEDVITEHQAGHGPGEQAGKPRFSAVFEMVY
jgi:hypothetical protein